MDKIIDIIIEKFKANKIILPVLLISLSVAKKEESIKLFLYNIVYTHITYETLHIIFQIIVTMLAVAVVLYILLNGVYYYKAYEFYDYHEIETSLPPDILKYASHSGKTMKCMVACFYIIWFSIILLSLSNLYTNMIELLPLSIAKYIVILSLFALIPNVAYKIKVLMKRKYL